MNKMGDLIISFIMEEIPQKFQQLSNVTNEKFFYFSQELAHAKIFNDYLDERQLLVAAGIASVAGVSLILFFSLFLKQKSKTLIPESTINSTPLPEIVPTPSPTKVLPVKIPQEENHSKSHGSANTEVDLEEFMTRLFSTALIVSRIKPDPKNPFKTISKLRCIKFNEQCDLCVYKSYQKKSPCIIQPSGGAYIRLPLKELKSCFNCEGSDIPCILIEFIHKELQLSAESKLETGYLLRGFNTLAKKLKQDSQYLSIWKQQYQSRINLKQQIIGNKNNVYTTTSQGQARFFGSPANKTSMISIDDDNHSVSTINTALTATPLRR
jgi:hypothetical protein